MPKKTIFLFLLISLGTRSLVQAQALFYKRNGEPIATYIKVGGYIGNDDLLGFSGGAFIGVGHSTFSISHRRLVSLNLGLGSDLNFFSKPSENEWEELNDFTFLYQYNLLRSQLFALNIGSGFTIGEGVYRKNIIDSTQGSGWLSSTSYEFAYDKSTHSGVPVMAEFTYKPFRFYAISVAGYYNFMKYPDYGFMISHSWGIIRKHRTTN